MEAGRWWAEIAAKHPETGEMVMFRLLAGEERETIPDADAVQELLKRTAVTCNLHLYGLDNVYSQVVPPSPVSADAPNTLIRVNLPYCLYVPTGFRWHVRLDPDGEYIPVVHDKVWTQAAAGSDATDLLCDTSETYHAAVTFNTPNFPQRPEEGPGYRMSGQNVELHDDTTGYFRYSRLTIYTRTACSDLANREHAAKAIDDLKRLALRIANRIIGVYRFVTGLSYVRTLAQVFVTEIYFLNENIGFSLFTPGLGVRAAMMNRRPAEVEHINEMLASSEPVPAHALLMLDAKASAATQTFIVAVLQAFQALEIFLEAFLRERLRASGTSEAQIDQRLTRCWRTKDRLRDLLKGVIGQSLGELDAGLWNRFCTVADKLRDPAIHHSTEPPPEKVEEAITVCEHIIALLAERS
jgi:hypothetical protein